MKVYDANGRLKVAVANIGDVLDSRYLRKDASDSFDAGLTVSFADAESVKFYNGKIYIYNPNDGKYYALFCATTDGVVSFFPSDVGITL